MTLPATTASSLSLSQIQTEFGGANPISLNEYYAGGAYVSSGTSGTYGAVPSSGAIDIYHFYGTAAAFTFTTTIGSTYDYNLHNSAVAAGWNGTVALKATVNVTGPVGASSTGSWAFNTGVMTTNSTVTINNSSYIEGATNSGPALYLQWNVSINNGSGYIFGGGGRGSDGYAAGNCPACGGLGAGYATGGPLSCYLKAFCMTDPTLTAGGNGQRGDCSSWSGVGGAGIGTAGGIGWFGGDWEELCPLLWASLTLA